MPVHDVTDINGNVLERRVERFDGTLAETFLANGDGTWEWMVHDETGMTISTENVDILPVSAVSATPEEIDAAKAELMKATTVAQIRARTVALFDLLNT